MSLKTDQVILAMNNNRDLYNLVNEYLEQVNSKEDISYFDFLNFSGLTTQKVHNENFNFNHPAIERDEVTADLQDRYWEMFEITETFFN